MAEEGFRLPGSPYEELANIIVAYGTRDEASNPGDVSKLNAVHQASVSRNNAFLTSIGVLRGEREKFVTEQGRALAKALSRRDRAGIQRNWRELVGRTEFMQNVLSAVKLREGIFPSTLQAYIAHYAGQPRNKPVMTGASAIIGILKAAGLLHEEAGMLVASYDEDPPREPQTEDESGEAAEKVASRQSAGKDEPRAGEEVEERQPMLTGLTLSTEPAGESGRVDINLNINCGPEDLDDLAPKIKRLLREIEGG